MSDNGDTQQPDWITMGHEMFNRATGNGHDLWPSQREAYVAGFGEATVVMQRLIDRDLKEKL